MITYTAMFIKKDGTIRKINFARIADAQHLLPPLKGGPSKNLPANQEMVWDMDMNNYRIFNWASVVGDVIAKRDF